MRKKISKLIFRTVVADPIYGNERMVKEDTYGRELFYIEGLPSKAKRRFYGRKKA